MTSERNPRDTVVGTVADGIDIDREGESYAIIRFQITTFGTPAEISVEYSWHPVQMENPENKSRHGRQDTGMAGRRRDDDGIVGARRRAGR